MLTKMRVGITAALVLTSLLSTTVFAADSTPAATTAKINMAAIQKALAVRHARTQSTATLTSVGKTTPAEVFSNPNLAYPQSCLNDGLPPFGISGLPYATDPNAQQFQVNLPAYDNSNGSFDQLETDTVTIWRVPCSGGVSATLLEIDRPASLEGTNTSYPLFPNIYLSQSGSSNVSYPRLAQDPNTVFSDTAVSSAFFYSAVYVLEYYNPNVALSVNQTDYNQAFTLNVDTLTTDNSGNEIVLAANMPAYSAASFNNYPSAAHPMPISGYMSTNWSNVNQGGEGIVMQIYDNRDNATRTMAFAWFTYDDLGLPFWLYGQTSFNIGTTQVTSPTAYFKGGSFAPPTASLGIGPVTPLWGTVTFTFPDCNDMTIQYNGNASADNGPTGSGTARFTRVANVNGIVCD